MIYLVAIIFPWLAMILKGKVIQGIICLFLQITILGWLPATIWAILVVNNQKNEERTNRLIKAIKNS